MRERPRQRFPEGSLLAAMLGQGAPVDVRRAAQRLRAEGAPAVAVSDGVAALAGGLALSEVSRSLAVLEALPPLFWGEARREDRAGGIGGWVVEKRGGGLALRGFGISPGEEAVPEAKGTDAVPFGPLAAGESEAARTARGLVAAIALPEMLAEMGESSPVMLLPAEAPDLDAGALRGLRLSVAVSPDEAAQ